MNTLDALRRFIAPLERRIYLIIGRAILTAVSNSGKFQRLDLTGLADETLSNVERVQEYGFDAYPFKGAEGTVIFLNGNRGHGLVICVNDRRYRPTDLVEGEVCVYTDEDAAGAHRIHFKRGQIILVQAAGGLNVEADVSVTGDVEASGDIEADGDISDRSGTAQTMATMRSTYNTHTHADPQGGNTGVPNPPLM